jgi:hypothetical protein
MSDYEEKIYKEEIKKTKENQEKILKLKEQIDNYSDEVNRNDGWETNYKSEAHDFIIELKQKISDNHEQIEKIAKEEVDKLRKMKKKYEDLVDWYSPTVTRPQDSLEEEEDQRNKYNIKLEKINELSDFFDDYIPAPPPTKRGWGWWGGKKSKRKRSKKRKSKRKRRKH